MNWNTFVTTSAARGGYLLRKLRAETLKQEQTIEDRTNMKKPWGLQKWKNTNKIFREKDLTKNIQKDKERFVRVGKKTNKYRYKK